MAVPLAGSFLAGFKGSPHLGFELGLVKVIPMLVHLSLDGMAAVYTSSLHGYSALPGLCPPYLIFGLLEIGASFATKLEPNPPLVDLSSRLRGKSRAPSASPARVSLSRLPDIATLFSAALTRGSHPADKPRTRARLIVSASD